jgi:hypothetical protein
VIAVAGLIVSPLYMSDCNVKQTAEVEQQETHIQGIVTDGNDSNVPHARISFKEIPDTTNSGADGTFHLIVKKFNGPILHVRVQAPGYMEYPFTEVQLSGPIPITLNKLQ